MSSPVTPSIPNIFVLDEKKLQSSECAEKQELYVFQWLAQVERTCKTISTDTLKKAQPLLEKTLLKLISLATAKPRRPIRFLIRRCFVLLYTRGDTRSLFDTVTALHSLVGASKNIDKETRIAAVSATGAIMGAVGGKLLSLFPETASILLKVIKTSSHPFILRLEAVMAFHLLLKGAGKASTEPILKDLTKQLKNGLMDKAHAMRVASAQCMQAVIQYGKQALTIHDIEQLLQTFFKAFENASFPVRRAVSSLCASLLVFTQKITIVDPNKPSVKYALTGEDTSSIALDPQTTQTGAPLMTIEEMFGQLSACYNRPNVSREFKIGLIETYATLFVLLGTEFIEANYGVIVKHVLNELLDNPKNILGPADGTFTRAQAYFLLHNTVGKRLLSEQGQASAIQLLVTDWIKSWPPLLPNQIPPNEHTFICATYLISSLVCELQGAVSSVQEILVEPLFVLLTHPSFSVQTAAVWAIRCVCYSAPSNIPYLLPKALNLLDKNLGNLANPNSSTPVYRRTIAYAHTAAAIMSVFPARPIYTSFELSARAMSLANQLLKQANKDPKIASVQIQVAWTLVGSLMGLGPNLVKLHLPQLLLLWKSALPKPTGKEANAIRSEAEWSFLFHTRECAANSIYSFLVHNIHSLVTLDIAKRTAALLNNALAFLATAPVTFAASTVSPCLPYPTRLSDQYYALRRRIFQCFVTIRPMLSTYEASLTSLVRNSLVVFTELDKISPSSSASTQITASVPGQFVSVWSSTGGHGYGVTSKMQGYRVNVATDTEERNEDTNMGKEWMTKDRFQRIEELLERPVLGSAEFDSLYVYTTFVPQQKLEIPCPIPPSTSYIDASIELFATIFPSQPPPVQESTFEHIAKVVKDSRLEKNSPRRAAILVNVVVALLGAFKNAMAHAKKNKQEHRENGMSPRATQLAQEILMEAVVHPEPYLRNAASETIGRLTAIVGGSFVASQMQQLVDMVVSNRDPDVRAGCALAIGYIYHHVGGMAAGVHLKTIVGILLSLSSDPHPVVHAWALEAMAMTVSAAGLMFSGYVNSTLGMVAKLYLSETHEPGSGSTAVSNAGMAVGFTAYQEFGRIVYELIGTLGPELQASFKIRELCSNIVEELKLEPDERVNVEAIRCSQHFLMFAPQHVDTKELVPYLQSQITSLHIPLKKSAVTCLYQLVQRDAESVFKSAEPGLDNELFKMLDTDPNLSDVKNVIRSWLKDTAVHDPSVWVNITKRIMTGSSGNTSFSEPSRNIKKQRISNSNDREDDSDYEDEDADDFEEDNTDIPTSVADASGISANLSINVEIPPKWRTQLFALQCLQKTIDLITASGVREHFDLILARKRRQQAGIGDYLVFRIPDLIRLSFTAATAHVNELRLAGIGLLRMVIERFAATEDADLEGMLLLEQYAAQIGAALTPAFGADSSSEIVSAAVRVCAIYVGSGIVKDLYQLGRVLKLLTSALDKCKDETKITGVGDVKDLSPHASVMVKLSVLNAWAELQVASQKQDYLKQILQPNIGVLSPLWLRALQSYARIRLESDIVALSSSTGGIHASSNGGIESMYSAATKEVVLPYYRRSWLKIMEAVATLMETQALCMLDALASNSDASHANTKPSNLFYILFGLCIESLSRMSSSRSGKSNTSTMMICLGALKTFIHPTLAGQDFVPKTVFLELMNVFDRLIQTEECGVQFIIIEVIQRLIEFYGANYLCDDLKDSLEAESLDISLDPDVFPSTAKMYYILRVLINVFLQNVPSLSNKPTGVKPSKDSSTVLLSSLDALTKLVGITPASYKVDILAICFYVFSGTVLIFAVMCTNINICMYVCVYVCVMKRY
ncbi:armadillo-type protein [Spinellus fusiger]|nr:armadillo-type protein [Spinellus fusiger]